MPSFGPFNLGDSGLARDDKPVPLGVRGLALLRALAEVDGPVGKAALLEAGWPGLAVEEGNLTVQVAALRKALGTREDGQEWIVTVPRVGYRLLRGEAAPPVAAAATPGLPKLAVLPFQNLSGDPEQDYFADGLVDELITAFSRFKSFAVIARSSSFAFKGRQADARQIATEMGVRYLLQGSVRRGGDRLRLVAQLVDGGDGASLWAQTFEGVFADVFEFQDRITTAVAGVVEPHIQRAELDHSRRERPGSVAAYDLFLQGVAKLYMFTPDENGEAIGLLERAVEIEPKNGLYLCYLVWALEHRTSMSWPAFASDDVERGVRLAHQAVALAPDDATVLARCGLAIEVMSGDFERGVLLARRAVESNPNDVVALINSGIAELLGGDLNRALTLLQRAVEITPGSAEGVAGVGAVYMAMGRYEEAVAWGMRARALNRRYIPSYWTLVGSYAQLGNLKMARAMLEELLELVPGLTIKSLAGVARTENLERDKMVIDAMRQAGLPEGA